MHKWKEIQARQSEDVDLGEIFPIVSLHTIWPYIFQIFAFLTSSHLSEAVLGLKSF